MRNDRMNSLDFCRAICIISVIVGHALQTYAREYMQLVYSFHMPMLFLISGFFLNTENTWNDFLKKRGKRLLLPYYIFGLFVSVGKCLIAFYNDSQPVKEFFKWIYIVLYGSGSGNGTKYFYHKEWITIEEIGPMWFLLALFWGSLLVKFFYKRKYSFLWIIVISLIGIETSKYFWLPLSIQNGMSVTFWIYFGIWIREEGLLKKIKEMNKMWFVIAGMAWILSIRYGTTFLYQNLYGLGIFDVLGAMGASLIIYMLTESVSKRSDCVCKVGSWIGRHTMTIFLIHCLESRFGMVNEITYHFGDAKALLFILKICITLIVCMVGTFLIEKMLRVLRIK